MACKSTQLLVTSRIGWRKRSGRLGRLRFFDLTDGISAEVPGLDDPSLGFVDIFLVRGVFDADAHAVLGENDILLAHSLRSRLLDFGHGYVDLPENPGDAANKSDGYEKGKDLTALARACQCIEPSIDLVSRNGEEGSIVAFKREKT